MAKRNYDNPDPAAVVRSIAQVLEHHDIDKLTTAAYKFVITHCGYIAHYDYNGFKTTYRRNLDDFVEFFLHQHGHGWEAWLNNPNSFLYDITYRGIPLATTIKELQVLFKQWAPIVQAEEASRRRVLQENRLNALAEELGYDVTKRR